MPFKGDMRLGGRHSNVASLNGTASDFVSVPALGTVLSGPTDTSRYVNDFLGTPFYMPYSTTVYADGLGGQNSVETWGLQYLPAGWVTATSQNPLYISWGPYVLQGDSTVTISGTWNYAMENLKHIEDGTGINYTSVVSTTYAESNGYIIDSNTYGTGADRYRVVFYSSGPLASISDYSLEPIYGTTLGFGSVDVTYTAPCQSFVIGSQSVTLTANGYGGSFNINAGTAWNPASYLGYCGNQNDGYQFYHHDGNGTVTQGNAPNGFTLSESPSSSSFQWSAPDGSSGSFTYEYCNWTVVADGNGGSYGSGGCSNASNGEVIASGSYVTGSTMDENGNTTDTYGSYQLVYNGGGGYNTNTY
jgi:hypothetical protein